MTDYAIADLKRAREPVPVLAPSAKAKARAHRCDVDYDSHRAILAGREPGRLDDSRPAWAVGDVVAIHTATTPTNRQSEDPVRMTVTSLVPQMVCDLTVDHAKSVGLRLTTEVQRLALGLPLETPAAHVNMAARNNQTTVWLTGWTRVESDAVRLVRDAGWQAPTTPLQWRPTDAGEAVHPDDQRTICEDAQPFIIAATERAAAANTRRLRVTKAKATVAHRESTRRRRIETARTSNSSAEQA